MAKKKTSEPSDTPAPEDGENTAGYFRNIFEAQPRFLRVRSNKTLLKRWLADHPGETEVPLSVKNSLANLKSSLRSKKRKRKAHREEVAQGNGTPGRVVTPVARKASGGSDLEALELQIDECLILARILDRDGLHEVISLLRRARNAVVWKIG